MPNTLPFLFSLYRSNAVMTRRLAVQGLDFNDFMIIYFLNQAENKSLRRIDLAHKLGLTPSGATRLILPLEKLGIVERGLSVADNRARLAILTPAGERLLSDALTILTDKLDEAIPQSDKKNFPEFSTLLDKITENLLEPEYRAEAKIRWGGTDAWKQSQDRVKNLSKEDMDMIKKESDELMREIAAISDNDPAGPAAQALIARHYAGLKHFYEPNLELYRGLAEMYVADPRFQAYHDKFKPGLARFMQSAMIAFCEYHEKP